MSARGAGASARGASAPGKVMLAGEYAVLEGADAVLMAVDRRVHATLAEPAAQAQGAGGLARSPFLAAVHEIMCAHAGTDSAEAEAALRLIADSSALAAHDGTKLGLGSSAAVTVAACACALARSTQSTMQPAPALIHRLAHAAHGAAQARMGARGSGADIAASVHGGVVAVRMRAEPDQPLLVRPLGLHTGVRLVFLWTGASAATTQLVARIHAWRQASPAAYGQAIARVADAAAALIASLRPSAAPTEAVAALAAGSQAIAALGRDAGVELETETHRAIAALASGHGGAAKPTGAGGGDIALAAFASATQAEAFCAQAAAQGLRLLDLRLEPQGVLIHALPGATA